MSYQVRRTVYVALPNGHAAQMSLLPSSTVQDLRTAAQQALGKNLLKLITAENRVLVNPEETFEEAKIEDGGCLPYSSGTSTRTGSNRFSLCLVVSWI